MLNDRRLAWLHSLQGDLALKRDWVAVGHIQALIDHIACERGTLEASLEEANLESPCSGIRIH